MLAESLIGGIQECREAHVFLPAAGNPDVMAEKPAAILGCKGYMWQTRKTEEPGYLKTFWSPCINLGLTK